MYSVDHLHAEVNMLKVREHSELLSALFTRHRSAVEPMMITKDRKATLKAIHTMAVNQAVTSLRRNVVLDDRPPLINVS